MQPQIIETVRYFLRFGYPPTLEEIWLFLSEKISRDDLAVALRKLIHKKILETQDHRYTVGEYGREAKSVKRKAGSLFENYQQRQRVSGGKIKKSQRYIDVLSRWHTIRLIGFSGSVAMRNADADADIDLFIITGQNRIWTSRLVALMLAQVMGLRRKRGQLLAPDKICLNLFFSESALQVPLAKQNQYVAHEVLQMKPAFDRGHTYARFVLQNDWVLRYFPNAKTLFNQQKASTHVKNTHRIWLGDIIEHWLRKVQLWSIRKHQTTELVSDSQLWFFPDDYEKKIKV